MESLYVSNANKISNTCNLRGNRQNFRGFKKKNNNSKNKMVFFMSLGGAFSCKKPIVQSTLFFKEGVLKRVKFFVRKKTLRFTFFLNA